MKDPPDSLRGLGRHNDFLVSLYMDTNYKYGFVYNGCWQLYSSHIPVVGTKTHLGLEQST